MLFWPSGTCHFDLGIMCCLGGCGDGGMARDEAGGP
jgi:hypothetical protein